MKIPDKRYFRTDEIADLFNVKPYTVRRWIHSGRLVCIKTPGGELRIEREQIISSLHPVVFKFRPPRPGRPRLNKRNNLL